MKQGLCLPYCVSRTLLRVRLVMCVVCYAAWDWLWVTRKDSCCVYDLVNTTRIFYCAGDTYSYLWDWSVLEFWCV